MLLRRTLLPSLLLALVAIAPGCDDDIPGCDQHEETEGGCGEGGSHHDGATTGSAGGSDGGGSAEGGATAACSEEGAQIFCRCADGLDGIKVCEDGAFTDCKKGAEGAVCS